MFPTKDKEILQDLCEKSGKATVKETPVEAKGEIIHV